MGIIRYFKTFQNQIKKIKEFPNIRVHGTLLYAQFETGLGMDKIIYLWDLGLKLPFINPKLQLAIPKTEPIYENSGAIAFNGTHLVIGGVNQVGVLSLKNMKVLVVQFIADQTGNRGLKIKKIFLFNRGVRVGTAFMSLPFDLLFYKNKSKSNI